mgnify:CR=1 FL=1|jgi:hypothetical protein|nr:MAG TPA: hypothetical protein [Bacteriophage sp.]
MKWLVKKKYLNEYITFEGVNIGTTETEIKVSDDNGSAIRAVKNTLSRLKREGRIEIVSGDVPEKVTTVYAKRDERQKLKEASPAKPVPAEPAPATREEDSRENRGPQTVGPEDRL